MGAMRIASALVLLFGLSACAQAVGPNRIRATLEGEIPESGRFVLSRARGTGGQLSQWERLLLREMNQQGFVATRSIKKADFALVYDTKCSERPPDLRPVVVDPLTGMPREIGGTRKPRAEFAVLSLRFVDLRPTREGGQPLPLWLASATREEPSCGSGLGLEWLVPRMFEHFGEDIPRAASLRDEFRSERESDEFP